ncbi:hypothetical protein D3C75_909620 [compost metagenome]
MAYTKPTTNAATTPNTMTEPASLNIFPPTPSTRPSARCSSAAEHMLLAKPVTGTADPAPHHWDNLSYTPKLVRITEMRIRTATVGLEASREVISKIAMNASWMPCPSTQIKPPDRKARIQFLNTGREGTKGLDNFS